MRIFLISNMYPSEKDQLFGVFVKNFKQEMENHGVVFPKTSLIRGKSSSGLQKVFKYLRHYWSVLYNFFTFRYEMVYIHFLTHHIPILILLIPFIRHPLVVNFHGSDLHLILNNRFITFWANIILKKIDLLIVPSNHLKEQLLKIFLFLEPRKIYVSPSGGIDGNVFFEDQKIKKASRLRLGFISRLNEEKGWRTFLEAMTFLKSAKIDFEAIVGGKGEDEKLIQNKIKQLGLEDEISYIGFVPQKKLNQIYNNLDLYIFPTYRDSLGLTGLEAMSCGTPVIASRIEGGPTSYIVDGKNGYLFTPRDGRELHERILTFVGLSPEQKKEMARNALQTARQYERGVVATQLRQRLQSCLEKA